MNTGAASLRRSKNGMGDSAGLSQQTQCNRKRGCDAAGGAAARARCCQRVDWRRRAGREIATQLVVGIASTISALRPRPPSPPLLQSCWGEPLSTGPPPGGWRWSHRWWGTPRRSVKGQVAGGRVWVRQRGRSACLSKSTERPLVALAQTYTAHTKLGLATGSHTRPPAQTQRDGL